MDVINSLAGSYLQGTQVQRQQLTEKQRQARRTQILEKDVTARDDQLEHQVESAEELAAIHDEPAEEQPRRKGKRNSQSAREEEPTSHLDLTA